MFRLQQVPCYVPKNHTPPLSQGIQPEGVQMRGTEKAGVQLSQQVCRGMVLMHIHQLQWNLNQHVGLETEA